MRLLSLIVLLAFSNVSLGSFLQTGDVVRLTWPGNTYGHANGGGEFWIEKEINGYGSNQWQRVNDAVLGDSYNKTFCLEYNEHISLGQRLIVAATSSAAYLGGMSAPNGDPLGDNTKWLYEKYASGDLRNYNATITGWTNNKFANAVQSAIWGWEGEATATTDGAYLQSLYSAAFKTPNNVFALNLFADNATTKGYIITGNLIGGVKFSATDRSTWAKITNHRAQDQLLANPTVGNTPPVPEPATAALFGIGALAAGFYRARRNAKKSV